MLDDAGKAPAPAAEEDDDDDDDAVEEDAAKRLANASSDSCIDMELDISSPPRSLFTKAIGDPSPWAKIASMVFSMWPLK